MSGLTEVQVLCVSVQRKFREKQSDRQVDLLWEMLLGSWETLPRGLNGLQFYNEKGGGEKTAFFKKT